MRFFADQIVIEGGDPLKVVLFQIVLRIGAKGIGEEDAFAADLFEFADQAFVKCLSAAHFGKGKAQQLIKVLIGQVILVEVAAIEGLS